MAVIPELANLMGVEDPGYAYGHGFISSLLPAKWEHQPGEVQGRGELGDFLRALVTGQAHWAVPTAARNAVNALGGMMATPYGSDIPTDAKELLMALPLAGVPASLAARQEGSTMLGMFAGAGAKTADLDALARAKSLATSGADRTDILKDTGWFQGADGQWRFEIPDDQSQIGLRHQGYFSELGETSGAARAVLEHPALYEAYPDLGKIRIDATRTPNRRGGQHAYGDGETITVRAPDAHNLRSVGLHELQHAVQLREGFAPGGSAAEMGTRLPDAQAVSDAQVLQSLVKRGTAPEDAPAAFLNLLGRDVHPAARHLYMRHTPDEVHYMDPTNAYRALAGEVEARNVQSRMGMNADQLRATPPWQTQDVPNEQQIIRRLLGIVE